MRWLLPLLIHKLRSGCLAVVPSAQPSYRLLYLVKTGFLVVEIASQLSYKSRDINRLFFEVMISSPESLLTYKKPIVRAAAHMLEWYEAGDDLPEQISLYKSENRLKRAMFDVYFQHKKKLLSDNVYTNELSRRQKERSWLIYREVLAASTHNKLQLVKAHEIEHFKNGVVLVRASIKERTDIALIRNEVKKCFEERLFSTADVMRFLLVLSEAMTNAYKHAEHGIVTIVEKDIGFYFIVEDSGPGIPLDQLPKAAMLSGYSTQKTLGQGFTIMMKSADCLYLCTTEYGSSLVLAMTPAIKKTTDGISNRDSPASV